MRFAFPLGLIGLVGIPVLILIYIIKSKYTEQVIPSTYLWNLSERFLKRKKPISKVAGIISLILQILIVLAISLTIAQPVFTIKNSAREYCFILDGSGSMQSASGKTTRFEKAKSEIKSIVSKSKSGSKYSLVFIGDTTYTAFDDVTNKKSANMLVDELVCGWSSADGYDALAAAQQYFDANSSTDIYFVTDKDYEAENLTVINVAASASYRNYALSDCEYSKWFNDETQTTGYAVSGNAVSYTSDARLTLELYVDGSSKPYSTVEIDAFMREKTPFRITTDVTDFSSLRLCIGNSDSFMQDNTVIFYATSADDALPTLLVGDDPFYVNSALTAVSNTKIVKMTAAEYKEYSESASDGGNRESYGLYVFDRYTPERLPVGGTVWLVNPSSSIPKSGFTFQRNVNDDERVDFYEAQYTDSSDPTAKSLVSGLVKSSVVVHKYTKYAVSSGFTTVLSCESNPVVFAGVNENYDKQVVIAFDIGETNLALSIDYLILMKNLYAYSLPSVIDRTNYTAGDTLSVNVINGCSALVLKSPSGRPASLATSMPTAQTTLTEAGTYTLTATVNDADRVYTIFVGVPESESSNAAGGKAVITGTKTNEYSDGFYDRIIIYLILLAVFFMADWGVYCYEQYQLR